MNQRTANGFDALVMIEVAREAYSKAEAAQNSATVAQLREMLEDYDDDARIVLSHDGGYTYGGLHIGSLYPEYIPAEE